MFFVLLEEQCFVCSMHLLFCTQSAACLGEKSQRAYSEKVNDVQVFFLVVRKHRDNCRIQLAVTGFFCLVQKEEKFVKWL